MHTPAPVRTNLAVGAFIASACFCAPSVAATFTVTTHVDSGLGSLRQAVLDANANPGADTIDFDPVYFDGLPTIAFGSEMVITESVTIDGPPNRVVLSGNLFTRMFRIDDGFIETSIVVVFRNARMLFGRVTGSERGAAISTINENITLINCELHNNEAVESGGAVSFFGPGGTLSMTGCTATSNVSTTGGGGAMAFNGSTAVTITNSTFFDNTSRSGGAINQAAGGSIDVQRCTFQQNNANPFNGGALFLNSAFSSAVIRNNTLWGNSASSDGGAIALGTVFAGVLQVENCTVVGNSANFSGGAISRLGGSAAINITSTIVSNNSAGFLGPAIFTGGVVNAAACLIQSASGVTTFNGDAFTNSHIGVNPMISDLANHGGPTMTHLLLAGSPAIDNGQNPAGLVTDQRGTGFARVIDGNCDRVPAPDIGALEAQICACPGDANENGTVDIDDLVLIITSWGSFCPPGGILADVNNDGVVNIDDLVTVITGWGVCR